MPELDQSVDVRPAELEPIERVDISEATYTRIREMIVLGHLVPGSKIDLDFLADSLQIGRTTVANALQDLQLEDLVHIVPRRGTFVSRFTSQQVREVYEMRMCLELWAARKAAASITDEEIAELNRLVEEFVPFFEDVEHPGCAAFARKNRDFHTYLVGLCHNDKMLSIYQSLPIDVLGYRVSHIRETSGLVGESASLEPLGPAEEDHREHKIIVQVFEARDPSQAEDAIRAHLERAMKHHLYVLAVLGRD